MRKLKLFFACMLLTLLSIGQVWASNPAVDDVIFKEEFGGNNIQASAYTFTGTTTWSGSTTGLSYASTSTSSLLSNATANPITSDNFFFVKASASTLTMSGIAIPSNVTEVIVSFQSNKTIVNCTYSFTGGDDYATGATSISGVQTFDIDCTDESTLYLKFTKTGTSSNARIDNVTVTVKAVSGGGSDPSLTVTPTSWNFGEVAVSDEASKVFSVSGSNLTAGTLSISVPEGFSVSPSSISVTEATLAATNVTVSKNTNTIDDYSGNLSISGCGLEEAKNVALEMSVVADPKPTGTFELFSGDIEEGDYVIYYNGKAMNTTITNSRFQYIEVTPSEGEIDNPDESIIWHIAPISETSYWTIYSAAESKYAGGTNSKNQGAMLAEITDLAKWTITGSSTYDFENYGRSQASSDSGNKWLRNNGTSGFATYANTMGGALTLYKKKVAGQPKAPTFSIPGGNYEEVQSVEISCETEGVTIHYTLDGTKPTSSSPTYSTALNISSTTTVKAVAIKDNVESTVASATYTIVVWQTVADVWDDITADGPNNAHIYGYVSQINVGNYANNFYISDNGSTEGNQLYAYRMNMNSFSVAVGDKVKLAGDLTEYQGTKEFKYANSGATQGLVVALEAKGALQSVAVSGTPTKTEYAANEDFDPAGLKVYGTYANGFVGEITEGITWGNDLTDGKVTENTTVHVTATVNEVASPAYDVAVTVAAKTLESIAVGTASYTIYTGETLPKPVVTATFSEGEPEDVSAFAVYDTESVFDTEVIDDPDPQTITVSYTFGGATETVTYTVSVKDYANANDAPYTVTEALHIITDAIGSTESAREIVVVGTVNEDNISNNKNRYKISDGVNELLVYAGKGFNNETFTNTNYPKVGDVVKVKGKVINYNNNTPEFASAKSYLLSQVRPATLAIEDVASFEVGATDLTESDLDITTPSDGDITFVSGDDAVATIEANAIHAVAPGTVTITANLAATENDDALNYTAASTTFDVTVIATTVKYAITFDGNGNTGGSAPEAIADKAAGAEVTLPANTYTKTGYTFDGWKVTYVDGEEVVHEVTIENNAFEMPASNVTIQAQWAEISKWATTYTSNLADVNNGGSIVKFYGEDTEYKAIKAGTGKAAGSTTITVPAQASKLHFHAYGWNGESVTLSITAPAGVTVSPASQAISANTGISGSTSTYTLAEGSTPETDAYFAVNLSGNNDEIELTISATSGNRFVLFGVNQEGGVLPVLDHIAITGTMTNTTGWKTGDEITPEGLTVNAIYTLNSVEQDPVDVTSSVVWSHAALVEDQTEVTLTATYTEGEVTKTATTDAITIDAVETGAPSITTDVNSRSWTVDQNADIPASKTFAVTLKNITSATVTLGGDNPEAFNVSPSTLTASGNITVSVVSTATVNTYSATITIKDDASETSMTVNVNLTVNAPVVEETAVSTTSEWVAATATDLVDGKQVLITGVKDDVTYAMGGQNKNNRAAVAASVDGEDVLTPGENTMSFTLVAQETEGVFALRTSNGKYLYAAASGDNYMKTQDNVDANAQWTISATSAVAESSSNRNVMQFNGGSSLFSCYNTASQSAIQFYVPKPVTPDPEPELVVITDDDAVISDVDAGADVVVKDGGVLTVDDTKTINSIVIEAGGVLALGANTLTADELIIQANGATSSQMTGVVDANPATSTESNVNVGEIYFEKKNFVTACRHWYNVAVPFPVNVNDGILKADGTPLTQDANFNFYYYDGENRALNGKGNNWIEETNQLQPGVNYQCVFDQAYGTIRFKKADGALSKLNNGANIEAAAYTGGADVDANWNGIANNGLTYAQATLSKVSVIQVLNAAGTAYEPQTLAGFVMVVGMPFFVQGAGTFTFKTEDGSGNLYSAPQRTSDNSFELIAVELNHNGQRVDRLYVSASEDATSTYELGKDVAKFTSNNTAQLWVNNYNEKLCVNDVPLANNQAIYDLGLYAPAAGIYSISAQQVEGATLYVTYNGAIVWNLSLGDYELDLTRGTTTGYGLLLVAQPNQMPTGLDTTEGVSGDAVQKILLNGQLYILRDGHLFDAVGHEMK